ncbi:hybrid sensor histidine kinase/response regulator [Turneriella parva]|uniref:histidine kinase n=1 Tax=Turneriella parva (strain ATCC BAA-1111 / DSM 21527 / NCTC 11395 / H) TaxID=869212 RepID=I4B6T1_TURPD|nr:PAS domain S-box protein [Turneriella parva]AFM12988.1 PAS/PAC sensor hybrid histidine kinase [Turneriella parva DSM 21527]
MSTTPEPLSSPPAKKAFDSVEAQLGHFLNISGTPTLVKDSASRILIANDAACEILGMQREAIIGKVLIEELPADEIEHFLRIDRLVLETGVPHTCEEKLTGATGKTHTVITTKTRHVDDQGKRYLVVVFMDITGQRQSADRVRFQGQMLDAIGQAVISTDTAGFITYWNHAAEEIYGYKSEEVIGRPIYEVTVPQASDQQAHEIMQQLAAGNSWSGEFEVKRRDGTTFLAQVLNLPMTNTEGALIGIMGVSADITESKSAREAKRLADQMLEKAFSASPVGMALVGLDGRFLRVNAALCRIVGMTEAELTATNFPAITHPDDVARDSQALRDMLEGRRDRYFTEKQYRHKDGHWVPVQLSVSAVRSDTGSPLQFVSIMQDITDRKRVENAARFQAQLLNAISQSVIGNDPQGNITFLNKAAEELYGYSAREAIGMSVIDLTMPKMSHEQAQEILTRLAKREPWSGEFLVTRRDGRTFIAQVHNAPITDHAGKLIGIIGVSSDITERKRAETELRRTSELLERTGALAKTGGWQVDLESMKLTWTQETFRIAERDSAVEPALDEGINLFAPEARDTIAKAVEAAMTEGTPYDLQLPIITEKGRHKWVQTQGFAEKKDGKVIRIYGTFQDITAAKLADEKREALETQLRQSRKLQAIGTLAGGIAHDFNNIIASILGNVSLAIDETDERSEARHSLREIEKSAARARALVQQLLAFSRQQPVARRNTLIAPIVIEVARLIKSNLPETIQLVTEIRNPAAVALVDTTQIEQALLNITTNAMQALQARPGRIVLVLETVTMTDDLRERHVQLKTINTGTACTRIVVEDNGPGIAANTLERIFEPFFTTKGVNEGTGLGLSVVHGIVEAHQGVMVVESEPGVRTAFSLYLVSGEKTATGPDENHAATKAGEKHGGHIVFIDDEESMVRLVKIYLQRLGYRVSGYMHAEDALQALRENPDDIDLVISDFNMPGTSGIQVAKEAHKIRSDLKVALASGYVDESMKAQVASAGIELIIPKADGMELFCNTVELLLSKN